MSIPVLGGIDPGRVAAIELASDQAKKTGGSHYRLPT